MHDLYPSPFPPPWASAWGDDCHGLWADLRIQDVMQRMRWIPPGQFLMGSSAKEANRYQDEGPQHKVTLMHGYWLADTACTQALWRAVMRDDPSKFNGDDLPVEQVSWDDVQQFLAKLSLAPFIAVLPTEAQWEYACRAGTSTPFYFGDTIRTDQVNYDGNYPYGNAPKGEYRAKTVTVKALPANAWGLYQMHGNVREWCADGARDYLAEPVVDPSGALDGDEFVVRGGCWLGLAQRTRSAQRLQLRRSFHLDDLGFRFALRFQAQEPEAPVLSG